MKLHLGCGKKFIAGFVHIDLLDLDHIDYKTSVDDLHFAGDNSVDLIYASHVLEHFGRNEYKKVLMEWFRVLKPNGILRVAVPDFGAVVKYYNDNPKDLELLLGLVVGGQKANQNDYHNMIFDENLLTEKLKCVGFREVALYDWRNTEHCDLDDFSQAYLPHMDKENGLLMSLNIEAMK
ncbi:methyltransferase domain-containing protein [Marinomonas sp. THO17]|uniref:class I SAM-dependent methyltransferase n=1 Tax=Marinomonas sp. THO17 TaxID=3149048 RepID=UPI00336BD3C0